MCTQFTGTLECCGDVADHDECSSPSDILLLYVHALDCLHPERERLGEQLVFLLQLLFGDSPLMLNLFSYTVL